jgi:hypothetical protein
MHVVKSSLKLDLNLLHSGGLARDKAHPWEKWLSWQTQGG